LRVVLSPRAPLVYLHIQKEPAVLIFSNLVPMLALAVGLVLPQAPQPVSPTELEGAWSVTELVRRGQAAPAEVLANMRFTFKGKQVVIRGNRGDTTEDTLPFTADSTATPRRIDIVNSNGATMEGIFELKENSLKMVFGSPRPTDFQAQSIAVSMTLKRVE